MGESGVLLAWFDDLHSVVFQVEHDSTAMDAVTLRLTHLLCVVRVETQHLQPPAMDLISASANRSQSAFRTREIA